MARATLGLAALGLLVHAAWIAGLGAGTADLLINDGFYHGVLALAAGPVCFVRAIASTAGARRIWIAFALGLTSWLVADVYYVEFLQHAPDPYPRPTPSTCWRCRACSSESG